MKDKVNVVLKGEHIVDKIMYKSGKVEVVERKCNLVVNSILPLIMGCLKGSLQGIQYWAIGSGAESWDSSTPEPSLTETKLTSEIGRKVITSSGISFVTPDTFEASSSPTTCLKVMATFDESECNGDWREFGIFGGNATTTKDSGYMLDKKHHDILTKTENMKVERTIYFTISFAG